MRLELFLKFPHYTDLDIFCGPGKNGLDGLNLARHAKSAGHAVRVYMSESSHSKNFLEKQSFSELKELDISVSSFDRFIPRKSIIVDAIFGVGINRSLPREVECTLRSINQLSNPKSGH